MKTIVSFLIVATFMLPALATDVDYTQPFAPDWATRGLWHFDVNTGDTIVPDASGNGNDATTATGIDQTDTYVGELDPDVTWVASMTGFDTCMFTWLGRWGQAGLLRRI